MKKKSFTITYREYASSEELTKKDRDLLSVARKATVHAYAPYSSFRVGAAALLDNNEIVTGTNQENASFPVGLCAERVLLSSVVSQFPGAAINTLAISYETKKGKSDHPIFPCGICRQALAEFEIRSKRKIRLILSGQKGKVFIIPDADMLLPLAFSGNELK